MPESRPRRWSLGVFAATLALGVLAAPAAIAQQDTDDPGDEADWEGSTFTQPADAEPIATETFPIAGTFVHARQAITTVEVDFGRVVDGVYDSADGDPCVPEDPGMVQDTPGNGLERFEFQVTTIDGDDITWPCNGRFLLRAVATSTGTDGGQEHLITASIEEAVPPPPVEAVDAAVDGERVTVSWEPLAEASDDALGYRVERAGPKDGDTYGPFAPVGDDVGTETTSVTDGPQVSGDYRYRVLALRHGAEEPVTSASATTAHADVNVTVSTTTTAAEGGERPRIGGTGSGRAVPGAPRTSGGARLPQASPPTTIDTGYEEELDYGDRPLDDDDPELAGAGEGQSIIRTEGGGTGLVAPAAGALVLLGWAGHVAYLNRLAKQF